MDPVDAHVSEEEEGDHADDDPHPTWESKRVHEDSAGRLTTSGCWYAHWLTQLIIINVVVQFAVSSDFGKEQRHSGDADPRQGCHGVFDFPLNLILQGTKTNRSNLWCDPQLVTLPLLWSDSWPLPYLQEVWVLHQVVVKDEEVADGPQAQVEDGSPQVGQHQQADDLPQGSVLGPWRRVHIGGQYVVIGNVQHKVHGWICDSRMEKKNKKNKSYIPFLKSNYKRDYS